jgi:hypothetical protein
MKKTKLNALLIVLSISLVGFCNVINSELFEEFSLDSKNNIQEFNQITTPKTSQYESPVVYKDTTSRAFDVVVSGNYAYVADWDDGLAVINISDPMNPGDPIYEDTSGIANGLFVDGNFVFIADRGSGLAVIDISDPTNPEAPNYEDTVGEATDVYIDGDYAFVADGFQGLAVLNISDPTNPGVPIYENTTGFANGVFISGDYAYVADGPSGLAVINISDPTNPGTPIYRTITGDSLGVYIDGDYAYLANGFEGGLVIIDISDPTNPGTPIYRATSESAIDVYISGNYAFIAAAYGGLVKIDISDPTNPGTPVYEDTITYATAIYVDGNYAYIADDEGGLAIFEISIPITPEDFASESITGLASAICVDGNYAYIADGDQGLAVIDISDPSNPGTSIYGDTLGTAQDVFISGNYAFIADGDQGLAVIDVSDPTNPGSAISRDTTGYTSGVYVSGNYAYIADSSSGLAIIDISNPTNPGDPVYVSTTGQTTKVHVDGNYAYLTNGVNLVIIDISDPTNPGTPIYRSTLGWAQDIFIAGDFAYIADYAEGLAVINISDPTNPGSAISMNTTGVAQGIYISGNYAFIADGSNFAIIDISDPTDPEIPVYKSSIDDARDVFISGEFAYIATGDSSLAVMRVRDLLTFKPSLISDLAFSAATKTSVMLSWTAPFIDDGLTNPISSYKLKYSTDPITDGIFDSATNFDTSGWLSLLEPGEIENRNITNLNPNTTYYFAMKSVDMDGDYSVISNIFNVTTLATEVPGGETPSDLSLLEKILYGAGVLLVIMVGIVVTSKKKRKQKKAAGKTESKAEAKARVKAEQSRLSKEKLLKKPGEVEKELKRVSAQIQEGLYAQAIASLKMLEKVVTKNKSLSDFIPEISKKLKFSENTTHFRAEKESFWEIYKSGEDFMGAYDGISKLKAAVEKFPSDSELIHPAVVLELNDAFQALKGGYEERKANLVSGISSISDISKPEEILALQSEFTNFEKEANALEMDYILPKVNDQRKRYEKNLVIYKEKEDLHLIFNQGDIIKANFGIGKLNDRIEEVTRESGEDYIYSAIILDISELSQHIQAEIKERNASLFDLNKHYETMFTPDQVRSVKELFGTILNDAETLGIKDLIQKINLNLNICEVSIPFVEEKEKFLQLYSEGQLENAYFGLESLKNRIEVHPKPDLVAPNIKLDIENTYDDIYNELKSMNEKAFGEIESIESLMKSEQISEAKTQLIQLQDASSQLGFQEAINKINRMIQVCNVSIPILDEKNMYWAQYADQNQLISALDGLQNLVENVDKGLQNDLILPSLVRDLREKIAFLKNKLDENRKEIEDKIKQISQTIDPEHLSDVIEGMKTQREIAQKLRFNEIDKKISATLIDFEVVSMIYELFQRAKRLAIADILRKSGLSREKLIDMMLDPEKGLEMLEIDGDFIIIKQLPTQPKQEIAGIPSQAESEEISQNQELQILREFEYLSGQVRFKVGVINQSPGVLTNINIHFTIPDALKWITHEPVSYKRKGDSVIIPKLSLNEKKSLNLYLEPISCMNGPINAIVSYFTALDEPKAITMRPKVIGITCPIFFTEEDANLARVESLYRELSHKDKKLLPIHKDQDLQKIFGLLLKVGGSHQIKLVSKEFSAENKNGKIVYYGLTKVKKQKMVIIFLLRGGEQTIEVEIAGDNEEAITALLAEIENQLRVIFTKEKIIKMGDKFHEMKTSVILGYCPFCGANFDSAQQEEFIKGHSITCEYCDKEITLN